MTAKGKPQVPETLPKPVDLPHLCGKCRHPVWSMQHQWQCGWRDTSYTISGVKK